MRFRLCGGQTSGEHVTSENARLVRIGFYFRNDKPGGIAGNVYFEGDGGDMMRHLMDVHCALLDQEYYPAEIIARLEAYGVALEVAKQQRRVRGEADPVGPTDEADRKALGDIYWLETRGHVESDNFNGVVMTIEDGDQLLTVGRGFEYEKHDSGFREPDLPPVTAWMRSLPPVPSGAAPTSKVGRNEPCPCGSGKKVKRCCGDSAAGKPVMTTDDLTSRMGVLLNAVVDLLDEAFRHVHFDAEQSAHWVVAIFDGSDRRAREVYHGLKLRPELAHNRVCILPMPRKRLRETAGRCGYKTHTETPEMMERAPDTVEFIFFAMGVCASQDVGLRDLQPGGQA